MAARTPTKKSTRKSKPRRASKKAPPKHGDGADTPWWKPSFSLVASIVVIAIMCLAIFEGLPTLEHNTSKRLAEHGVIPKIDWPQSPQLTDASGVPQTWMLPEHQEHIMRLVSQTTLNHFADHPYDPIDPDLLRVLSTMLNDTGWFLSTPRVERERQGGIHISGQWRAPGAVVRSKSRDYLVSLTGELLPYSYDAGTSPYHCIHGVGEPMPTHPNGSLAYGKRWQSSELNASLQLLKALKSTPYFHQILGVEASSFTNSGDRGQLVLLTDAGNRVIWGVPVEVNGAPFGDQQPSEKMKRLQYFYERSGRIDEGYWEIDITKSPPTVRNKPGL